MNNAHRPDVVPSGIAVRQRHERNLELRGRYRSLETKRDGINRHREYLTAQYSAGASATAQHSAVGSSDVEERQARLAEELAQLEDEQQQLERQMNDQITAFVELNKGLVKMAVKPFATHRQRWERYGDDYFQAGLEGLVAAFRRWDPDQGLFSHFGLLYIRGAVRRAVHAFEFPELSYGDWCDRSTVLRAEQAIMTADRDGDPHVPTDGELAEVLEMSEAKVWRLRQAQRVELGLAHLTEQQQARWTTGTRARSVEDIVLGREQIRELERQVNDEAAKPLADLSGMGREVLRGRASRAPSKLKVRQPA